MPIYEEFVGRHRDHFATLEDLQKNYKVTYPDTFNFAYDVLDVIAKRTPDKLCMLWLSNDAEERRFTFDEMSKLSNKAANFFTSKGIRKGDLVMLVLKRGYEFWYCMMGLHKIGAIAVQATHMLLAKDFINRMNAGKIKMIVMTGDGDCTEHFDDGLSQYETLQIKAVTRGKKVESWIDFDTELAASSDEWSRPTGEADTRVTDPMIMSFSSIRCSDRQVIFQLIGHSCIKDPGQHQRKKSRNHKYQDRDQYRRGQIKKQAQRSNCRNAEAADSHPL